MSDVDKLILYEMLKAELQERLEALPIGSTIKDVKEVCNDVITKFTASRIIVGRNPDDHNRVDVFLPFDWIPSQEKE